MPRSAAGLACALLALAGCGGGERAATPTPLPAALAERLAARSDAVADRLEAGDDCGARAEAETLQAETIAAVNDRRVPRRYQEPLLSSVTALVESIECAPTAPAPPAGDEDDDGDDDDEREREDDGEREEEGKGEQKGKGRGRGRG